MPGDANKIAPGMCGCFALDTDTDGDGVADCIDGCPKDPTRTHPGVCGCGVSDTQPLCLAHRYSFNDSPGPADAGAPADGGAAPTATIVDSVGTANGTLYGGTLNGTSVTLAGAQTDQHIALPSGIISSLGSSATFETWITWTGIGVWQRIFDFGASDMGPGNQGTGQSWIFLTPLGGGGVTLLSMLTPGLTEVMGVAPLPTATMEHLAVVINGMPAADGGGGSGTASLYINGALVATLPLTSPLTGVNDVNNWLGKSQFVADPEFGGTYYEFRIYSSARTAAQIMASFTAGPDTLPAQ
jgi:hypothetical protein